MTQLKSSLFTECNIFSPCIINNIFFDTLFFKYFIELFIKFFNSSSLMIGLDPILENLSVIILSLSKSFSISTIILLSFKMFFDFIYSFQAINDDNGVPN